MGPCTGCSVQLQHEVAAMRLQCKDAACGCSVQLQHVVAVMRLECKVAACGCSVQLQRVAVQHGCPPEGGGAMRLSPGQQLCSSPGGGGH